MLSARATEALRLMRDTGEEIVADGLQVWIGDEQFSWRTLLGLLRVVAVRDVSDTKGMQRYVINPIGESILIRPELADEVEMALLKGAPITVENNHIKEIA